MSIWLHPSVTSTIVDNSGFYATALGTTRLFQPGFFEKGKDNEIVEVFGPTDADLVKKFGNINATEYGQSQLNLVNWLTSGGSSYVMRCLPDNARYSHAVLEVLTKSSTGKGYSLIKTVGGEETPYALHREFNEDGEFIGLVFINDDGEKVFANATVSGMSANDVCDKILGVVALADGEALSDFLSEVCQDTATDTYSVAVDEERMITEVLPRISYVPSGATSKAVLDAYITNKQNGLVSILPFGADVPVSGYRRNILGYFLPEGRGAKYYNDFRIDIKLAASYDQNYDFRVYSLTFQKYDAKNEEWGIAYGPFYVSFDETARDSANESMFIADVLNTYCEEFDFVTAGSTESEDSGNFNVGFYNAAKAIAGASAPLGRVDILSCKEYYSEETGHSMIHRNAVMNGGQLTLRKNITANAVDLYINEITPIVNSTLIVAETKQAVVSDCNITSGKITVNSGVFTSLYYTDEQVAELPIDDQAEASTISVLKDATPVIYVNDLGAAGDIATVKTVDDAIRKITTKKFKIYLNNNGANFYPTQRIKIKIDQLVNYVDGDAVVSTPADIPGAIDSIDELNNAITVELDEVISGFENYDFGSTDDSSFDGAAGGSASSPIVISSVASAVNEFSDFLNIGQEDFVYMAKGSAGDVDTADGQTKSQVAATRKSLLVKAFRGTLNEGVVMKKFYPFDIVLDANLDDAVKTAINDLTRTREDFMFMCDTGFTANANQALLKRNGTLNYNNIYTAIFTQDMRVYDEYTNKTIKVTPTYYLAKKIPYVDSAFGVQYAFVGPNRGEIEGAVDGSLSWNPNEETKEKLYKKQLNYIQKDPNHFMFMGQLTSQKKMSSLSDIPNVRALLIIRRDVENMMEGYTFERINDMLLSNMTSALNEYLSTWVSNGTCATATGSVSATDYDKKQKLCRVNIELKFTSFLERVIITFNIK